MKALEALTLIEKTLAELPAEEREAAEAYLKKRFAPKKKLAQKKKAEPVKAAPVQPVVPFPWLSDNDNDRKMREAIEEAIRRTGEILRPPPWKRMSPLPWEPISPWPQGPSPWVVYGHGGNCACSQCCPPIICQTSVDAFPNLGPSLSGATCSAGGGVNYPDGIPLQTNDDGSFVGILISSRIN